MKTNKAIAKRFKVTKTGKVIKRCAGQDHFNTNEPGKVTRNKRRDVKVADRKMSATIKKNIL